MVWHGIITVNCLIYICSTDIAECQNDIIVAIDSSACFRDYFRRMKQFLQRLVGEIHRRGECKFGLHKTRLAIMQVTIDEGQI